MKASRKDGVHNCFLTGDGERILHARSRDFRQIRLLLGSVRQYCCKRQYTTLQGCLNETRALVSKGGRTAKVTYYF